MFTNFKDARRSPEEDTNNSKNDDDSQRRRSDTSGTLSNSDGGSCTRDSDGYGEKRLVYVRRG